MSDAAVGTDRQSARACAPGNTGAGTGGSSSEAEQPDAGGGTGSMAGAAGEPSPVACNPADMLPEAKVVPLDSVRGSSNSAPIAPAKGPLQPVITLTGLLIATRMADDGLLQAIELR